MEFASQENGSFLSRHCQERTSKMRLQTDREFQQTNIKKLNKQFDVDMYSTHVRGGKAFAAEQKIRELKKLLLRSKRIKKLARKRGQT